MINSIDTYCLIVWIQKQLDLFLNKHFFFWFGGSPFAWINSRPLKPLTLSSTKVFTPGFIGCTKFCWSYVIMCLVGPVLSCNCVFVIISWDRNIISYLFRGTQIFSRGFLVGPNFFVVGISWVQNIYSLAFWRFQFFCHGYLLGLKLFSVGISWLQNFFLSFVII